MARRKPQTVEEYIDKLQMAANAIPGEPNWPPTAPTAAENTAAYLDLNTKNQELNNILAAAELKRQEIEASKLSAGNIWTGNDDATTLLYTKYGAQKSAFGCPPFKQAEPMGAPPQVIIRKIADGPTPKSFRLEWEAVEGAAYEIEWSVDTNFVVREGSQTENASEAVIHVLQQGAQYWVRVRAVRAGIRGVWSDPATRVANV